MRSFPLQPVLALALLAAGPWVGCAGKAYGSFLVADPSAPVDLDLAPWATGLLGAGVKESPSSGPTTPPRADRSSDQEQLPLPEPLDWEARKGNRLPDGLRSSRAGETSSPSNGGVGGPALSVLVTRPALPHVTRVGLLFLEDTLNWPSPVASRLFRPPRVECNRLPVPGEFPLATRPA